MKREGENALVNHFGHYLLDALHSNTSCVIVHEAITLLILKDRIDEKVIPYESLSQLQVLPLPFLHEGLDSTRLLSLYHRLHNLIMYLLKIKNKGIRDKRTDKFKKKQQWV